MLTSGQTRANVAAAEVAAEKAFEAVDRTQLDALEWNRNEYDRAIQLGPKWAGDDRLAVRSAGHIRRADVFSAMPALIASKAWDRALVTVNAWGYGRVGYGHHRTSQILARSGFVEAARTAAELVAGGRPVEAYFHLNNRPDHVTGWDPRSSPSSSTSPTRRTRGEP